MDKKQTAKGLVDQMLELQVVVAMLVSSISKKFYTTLAGVDYMIGASRKAALNMEERDDLKHSPAQSFRCLEGF